MAALIVLCAILGTLVSVFLLVDIIKFFWTLGKKSKNDLDYNSDMESGILCMILAVMFSFLSIATYYEVLDFKERASVEQIEVLRISEYSEEGTKLNED